MREPRTSVLVLWGCASYFHYCFAVSTPIYMDSIADCDSYNVHKVTNEGIVVKAKSPSHYTQPRRCDIRFTTDYYKRICVNPRHFDMKKDCNIKLKIYEDPNIENQPPTQAAMFDCHNPFKSEWCSRLPNIHLLLSLGQLATSNYDFRLLVKTSSPRGSDPSRREQEEREQREIEEEERTSAIIIGVVVGMSCLIFVIIIIIVLCRKKPAPERPQNQNQRASTRTKQEGYRSVPLNAQAQRPQPASGASGIGNQGANENFQLQNMQRMEALSQPQQQAFAPPIHGYPPHLHDPRLHQNQNFPGNQPMGWNPQITHTSQGIHYMPEPKISQSQPSDMQFTRQNSSSGKPYITNNQMIGQFGMPQKHEYHNAEFDNQEFSSDRHLSQSRAQLQRDIQDSNEFPADRHIVDNRGVRVESPVPQTHSSGSSSKSPSDKMLDSVPGYSMTPYTSSGNVIHNPVPPTYSDVTEMT